MKARVVIPARDTSSWSVLHNCQVSWLYSIGYSSYRADMKLHLKWSRGNNSESITERVAILVCDTSSWPVLHTDTWGHLIVLTIILNHKSCINTSRQVLEKTLFAINAIFTQDNNLSKTKVEGSLQKTNATCSKCKTNLTLTYLHWSRRHSSSQSQKCESTILSDKNKLLSNISSVNEIFGPTQCCLMVSGWKAFLKCTASEQESQSVQIVFCSLALHVRKVF